MASETRIFMMTPGDIISYMDMCQAEGVNLQRGMNFKLGGSYSVILMSIRPGAPYADKVENNGSVLIYEGHDESKRKNSLNTKEQDQPMRNPGGSLTQNGLFFETAQRFKKTGEAHSVKVYEKIKAGIWVFNGIFELKDAWIEKSGLRNVFKFLLETSNDLEVVRNGSEEPDHNRMIPTAIKLAVWQRDAGSCVLCGSKRNLHFDHILPFSKGGTSLKQENVQLLCVKHNLEKRDKIQ